MKVVHYTLYPIEDLSRKSKQDLDLRFLGKEEAFITVQASFSLSKQEVYIS